MEPRRPPLSADSFENARFLAKFRELPDNRHELNRFYLKIPVRKNPSQPPNPPYQGGFSLSASI